TTPASARSITATSRTSTRSGTASSPPTASRHLPSTNAPSGRSEPRRSFACRSIPCRCEAGADEALALRQCRDFLAVIVVELDAERIPIRLLALAARGLRDRGNAVLIEQPFQRDLRRAGIVLPANGGKRFVGGGATLCQRTIGHQRNRPCVHVSLHLRLVEHRVIFDLIAGDRRLQVLDHGLEQRDVEIGNPDGARAPGLAKLHQRLEHGRQVHTWLRPVDKIEVDGIQAQLLQAGVEGAAHRVRREILVPDLCRDVQFAPLHARGGNRRADRVFIGIHFRSVDMAVAERKRALDCRAADIALHAIGAEPEPRQADALGLQGLHGSLLDVPHRLARTKPQKRIVVWGGSTAGGIEGIVCPERGPQIKVGLVAGQTPRPPSMRAPSTSNRPEADYFQSQMPPPVRHGHFCMRVSIARASSGLEWRWPSLTRAAPFEVPFDAPLGCTRAACVTLRGRVTCTSLAATFVGSAFSSLRAQAGSLAWSVFASLLSSTATGANSVGGPSRFGDSTAVERSSPRNSSGRYSSANTTLPAANKAAATRAGTTGFRTISCLLTTKITMLPSAHI